MINLRFVVFLTAIPFVLSGCASVRGYPAPLLSAGDVTSIARTYRADIAVETFQKETDPTKQQQYRDKVISAYFAAIDARYFEFRAALSGESRGSGLGFDGALLGLAAAGSLLEKSAHDLAAVSGFVAGARSSIDKNLYFDKAVPALFATMDAERLTTKTLILQRMKLSSADYPIEAAFADLVQYQIAGTIDEAVTTVTEGAAQQRAEAKELYARELGLACDVEASILPLRQKLGDYLRRTIGDASQVVDQAKAQKAKAKLNNVALALAVPSGGTVDEIRERLVEKLEQKYCSSGQLEAAITYISAINQEAL